MSFSTFDSTNKTVPTTGAWFRVLTQSLVGSLTPARIDTAVTGGTVNLRLTRTAKPGETHGLLKTDLTQPDDYVGLATCTGPGTVNIPQAGAIVCTNVDPSAGAEVGVEVQFVSGNPVVRSYGSFE